MVSFKYKCYKASLVLATNTEIEIFVGYFKGYNPAKVAAEDVRRNHKGYEISVKEHDFDVEIFEYFSEYSESLKNKEYESGVKKLTEAEFKAILNYHGVKT